MKIKKTVSYCRCILLVAVTLFLVGCGLDAISGSPTVETSTDGQFQVTIPAAWSVQTELHDEADIQVANPRQESYLIVLSESKVDFEEPTIEWHSNLTRSSLLEGLTGGQNSSGPKNFQINGNAAVQYEIRGTAEGLKVVYLHTTVDTGEHLHQILAWSLNSQYDGNRGELDSVINSFQAKSFGTSAGDAGVAEE